LAKVQRVVSVPPINWLKEIVLIILTGGLWSIVTIKRIISRAATR